MATVRRIRSITGALLRGLANLVTGNTFKRIEQSHGALMAETARARRAAIEARNAARRMHDAQQEVLLALYRVDGGDRLDGVDRLDGGDRLDGVDRLDRKRDTSR